MAWDLDRADWRSFRVDRLVEPVTTGARFRPRQLPTDDAASFVRSGIASVRDRHDVVIRVQAAEAEVASVVGRWAEVTAVDERSCVVRMSAESLDWPVLVLAAVGAEFEVVEPAEFRDYVRTVGDLFLRATAG